ncbi:MAG: peptide chain release factor-like protein [Rhodothermaceae bacterium]|nr:peptide chain release factor-like protein [Rhodothermaceae bacterium]
MARRRLTVPRFHIPDDNDALLAECAVDTFRSGGPGGQHANKVESAVRLTHGPSGLVVTSQASRSQFRNKALAVAELRRRLEEANRPQKRRIATRPTAASKRRRLKTKRQQSEKKALRQKPRRGEG